MRNCLRLLSRAVTRQYRFSPAGGGVGTYRCYVRFPSTAASLLDGRSSFPASHLGALSSSLLPDRWTTFAGQRRTMFIQTQSTPNPSSLMFHPGKPVMEVGSSDFPNARAAMTSPLAKAIFGIDGIVRVFYGSDFVTVTKSDDLSWDLLKPEIFAAIMDFYSSGQPLFLDSQAASAKDTQDDSETVAMIKELLETRIRPAVQDDGGDIEYCGFETGIVKLRMQGACSGCPSSSVTLKSGIENMLMHYVSEVKGVEQELDGEEEDNTSLAG
ncbi:NifU-like protein 4, mitochondrial [Linum perenne]